MKEMMGMRVRVGMREVGVSAHAGVDRADGLATSEGVRGGRRGRGRGVVLSAMIEGARALTGRRGRSNHRGRRGGR